MDELDKKISDMLNAEEKMMMDSFDEQGIFGQLGGLFHGKSAWLTVLTLVIGFAFAIMGMFAAWKFAIAEEVISMLRWGGLAWLGLFSISLIKLWSWMRMETNRTLREIKRLELQIAMMQAKG
ncbi:MAG: DUF6768 family protein [Alphaproteobacteria bacterium]